MGDDFADKKLFNIAADIEINQYIDAEYLPPGALLPTSFSDLTLPLKAGTKVYYELLSQAKSELINKLKAAIASGESTVEHESKEHDVPNHQWEDFQNLNEAEKKLIASQAENHLREVYEATLKSCGSVPGEIKDILSKLEPLPEKFNWKAYLRRFVGRSNIIYTKKLKRKFNKRFEENPGLKIKKKNHILVAVDTSGSVSKKELEEFFNEIYHIHKTGVEVTVVQCDSAISDISKYKPGLDIKIHGRGGTSFEPVIDYYDGNVHKYTALIYFTDGEASRPSTPKGNVLWVISAQSEMNTNLPGQIIQLN